MIKLAVGNCGVRRLAVLSDGLRNMLVFWDNASSMDCGSKVQLIGILRRCMLESPCNIRIGSRALRCFYSRTLH